MRGRLLERSSVSCVCGPTHASCTALDMAVAVEMASSALEAGAVIAGKYRVVRTLGEGGMGVVYETLHLRLQQHVAIKMLLPSLAVDTEHVERFEREARAAATIESPNVAKVMDVDVT